MYEFAQIIKQYESDDHNLSSFIRGYKNRSVEELELIILDFQALYQFGDPDIDREDSIPFEDWLAFGLWQPCDQTDFLAYLAIKITVAMN